MTGAEATVAVLDALEALGIPYLVVGSFASNFYGVARATQDADLVVHLGQVPIAQLSGRLGAAFHLDPQLSFETMTGTTRHMVEAVGTAFRIELFDLSDDAHDQERFRRRRRLRLLGREVWLPTVEDVIVTKLRWARPKDRDDVRNVMAVQAGRIDWDYVIAWANLHGSRALLDEVRASVPRA